MLQTIDQMRERTQLPYRSICASVKVAYSTYNRWRGRAKQERMFHPPGPKKVEPLKLPELREQIASLRHGKRRTGGATALYEQHRSSISRRELQRLIKMARDDTRMDHRRNQRRVEWLTVGTVWAMDDCEYDGRDDQGRKLYWNQTQDMASRYKLAPMAGEFPCGEEIAAYLEAMFDRYGPPLFFKRDNRGNLNHMAVNEVLSKHMVLPLNSPPYYAPYNGAVEHAQGELKRTVRARLKGPCPREHFEAYAEAA